MRLSKVRLLVLAYLVYVPFTSRIRTLAPSPLCTEGSGIASETQVVWW
jgi:hypothetical protein